MSGGGYPEDGLSGADSVGEAGKQSVGSVLRNLPFDGIDGDVYVHLAEEKTEDGHGA